MIEDCNFTLQDLDEVTPFERIIMVKQIEKILERKREAMEKELSQNKTH